MFRRPEIRIKAFDFQKLLEDFTGSRRDFTAYSTTKIDHITYFYFKQLAPWNNFRGTGGFMYSKYDTDTEELVFVGPPELDNNWFEARGLSDVRIAEINRPLEIRLLKP